jgi:RNA-binding protein NOB1
LRSDPNQKSVNGKPPGKTEDGADGAAAAEAEQKADAESPAEASESTKEQDAVVPGAADEAAPSDQVTSESVTEQLQDLDLNRAAVEEGILEDEEASTEDDEDGAGEWISSSTADPPPRYTC